MKRGCGSSSARSDMPHCRAQIVTCNHACDEIIISRKAGDDKEQKNGL
jgi:hypothetical protein